MFQLSNPRIDTLTAIAGTYQHIHLVPGGHSDSRHSDYMWCFGGSWTWLLHNPPSPDGDCFSKPIRALKKKWFQLIICYHNHFLCPTNREMLGNYWNNENRKHNLGTPDIGKKRLTKKQKRFIGSTIQPSSHWTR